MRNATMSSDNPYQSPPPSVKQPSDKSRKLEATIVKYFCKCRQTPPTWFWLWRRGVPNLAILSLLLIGALLLLGAFNTAATLLPIATFLGGVVLGSAWRDFGYCVRIAKQWPILESLLDWQKIEQKREEQDA